MDVFVYGTLLFPEVRDRVLVGRYPVRPAAVAGWRRRRIEGEVHPVAVPEAGAAIPGEVLVGVEPADVARLDAFEGEDYRRATATASFAQGGEGRVELYVLRPGAAIRPAHGDWDPAEFRRSGLEVFLDRYPGFGTAGSSAREGPPPA